MSSTASPACTISLGKDGSLPEKELHSIPCKIEYTGPANINGYFIQSKIENGLSKATFRGRGLEGHHVPVPEGYELFVLKERPNSIAETRRFDVIDRKDGFTHWEWDREPGKHSLPAKMYTTLRVAAALADD